jgi:hypothetical protein
MMEEQNVLSLLAVSKSSAHIAEQSFCSGVELCGTSLAFSFILQKSSDKILWQAMLLMFTSSDKIWTVI